MNAVRQPSACCAPTPGQRELSTTAVLAKLGEHRAKTLLFHYEGRDVLPGYHVTEVKAGAFLALDCGAHHEAWHETFIQLWDIPPEDEREIMSCAKFLAIIGKVGEAVPFDREARLTFEVSDGRDAIRLYCATAITVSGDVVRVALDRRPASCKPRDRWLEAQAAAAPCCAA